MFVDVVKVFIKSGKGGDGCVSFRREKFKPKGGPDGGDGGDGGHVIFIGDNNINTLAPFRFSPKLVAKNGLPGEGNRKFGKKGKHLKVKVPCGTIVKDAFNENIIAEILTHDEQVIIAKGGIGGKGNFHYSTPTDQAPRTFQAGTKAEEFSAILELKVIADVGLVGFPNAGKSSLISTLSHAKPKIANYPFTTLTPNLGVIDLDDFRTIVMADIPGLIEGASSGKGLGIKFLKHIERTKLLLFMVDCSKYADIHPKDAIIKLFKEIKAFERGLADKPYIIVANKSDLDTNLKYFEEFKEFCLNNNLKDIYSASSATKKGCPEIVNILNQKLYQKSEEDYY